MFPIAQRVTGRAIENVETAVHNYNSSVNKILVFGVCDILFWCNKKYFFFNFNGSPQKRTI